MKYDVEVLTHINQTITVHATTEAEAFDLAELVAKSKAYDAYPEGDVILVEGNCVARVYE